MLLQMEANSFRLSCNRFCKVGGCRKTETSKPRTATAGSLLAGARLLYSCLFYLPPQLLCAKTATRAVFVLLLSATPLSRASGHDSRPGSKKIRALTTAPQSSLSPSHFCHPRLCRFVLCGVQSPQSYTAGARRAAPDAGLPTRGKFSRLR
ncbi:unnamed protein product [Ixodes pacificus]